MGGHEIIKELHEKNDEEQHNTLPAGRNKVRTREQFPQAAFFTE